MTAEGATMGWAARATIYEINTWVWLEELSQREGRPVDLGSVPSDAWDDLCVPGATAVWLMGVWERSPLAAATFRDDPTASAQYRSLLPDYRGSDVVGSAYAVQKWEPAGRLGGDAGLATAREELARRGLGLVLDYVPNHTAPDHPWTRSNPSRYIRGTREDLEREPAGFFAVGDEIFARGRDPYFPPWPDVAQLDLFAPETRLAAIETLRAISDRADAVRVDMAMLALSDVFDRTWGSRSSATPDGEMWEQVIAELRRTNPGVVLLAEAYWGTEDLLIQQGFDACYDKELYDQLVGANAAGVRAHVAGDHGNRCTRVRFIENHDEPRAASAFAPGADMAAAIAIATLPGTTLWHEGQFDARREHLPVTLARRPDEKPDTAVRAAYDVLVAAAPHIRRGAWQTAETHGWADNQSCRNLLAWSWTAPFSRWLVVINLSSAPAQGRVRGPWAETDGYAATVDFVDALTANRFTRELDELAREGLYVDLPPWGSHVLEIR